MQNRQGFCVPKEYKNPEACVDSYLNDDDIFALFKAPCNFCMSLPYIE
jgi:hypothetical protein